MGQADYLSVGDWNVRCDRCGKKIKGSEARRTWQNYYVCPEHWEPRQPQDFVRSIVEHPTPAFVRNPPDTYLSTPEAIITEVDDSFLDNPWDFNYLLAENGLYFQTED